MEAAPKGIDPNQVKKELLNIPGVKEVHDLHIWSVTPQNIALSTHIVAEDDKKILNQAHRLLETNYRILHMTIQIEAPGHFESRFCYECDKKTKH
jgi:cobalt-zinc-cadmium efflux system protein